ncbi:uncharacterized protein UV8b_05535 [Ustilaginoidea virens]|uniref:Uncharacterized protein n=1 Tax=Ustilaginoidea virens TaxID=1159556 RepID=A0A8E5MJ60_USTVR|nr:uncharacterized protein UV8b_05535 [Ustilaginoidea virens]QUC21292.1 hypothetical protein UV8b_05535 [Ustilaginoidea virens]
MNSQTVGHGFISFGQPIPVSQLAEGSRTTAAQLDSATTTISEPVTLLNATSGLIATVQHVQRKISLHSALLQRTGASPALLGDRLHQFKKSIASLRDHLELAAGSEISTASQLDLDTLIVSLTACILTLSSLDDQVEQACRSVQSSKAAAAPASQCMQRSTHRISILNDQIARLASALRLRRREAMAEYILAKDFAAHMLQTDSLLCTRMRCLEDHFSTVPAELVRAGRSPPGYSVPKTAEQPPAYGSDSKGSVQVRAQFWSVFSGCRLGDIGGVTRVCLPVNCDELSTGELYSGRRNRGVGQGSGSLRRLWHKSGARAWGQKNNSW